MFAHFGDEAHQALTDSPHLIVWWDSNALKASSWRSLTFCMPCMIRLIVSILHTNFAISSQTSQTAFWLATSHKMISLTARLAF